MPQSWAGMAALSPVCSMALLAALLGGCSDDEPVPSAWWDVAASKVGEVVEICGPVAEVTGTDDAVFINVGVDYPDPDRFTIVVWGKDAIDEPAGATHVCASGEVSLYKGVAQMEVSSPSNVDWSVPE